MVATPVLMPAASTADDPVLITPTGQSGATPVTRVDSGGASAQGRAVTRPAPSSRFRSTGRVAGTVAEVQAELSDPDSLARW